MKQNRVTYIRFREALQRFGVFSLHDAQKHFPGFDRKRLSQWQAHGYIRKIIREYYCFSDLPASTEALWLTSNVLAPSYVSLQSALGYYGFIPEGVFQITGVSTKRTRLLTDGSHQFMYRSLKPEMYWGYRLIPWQGRNIRMAEPEKALLDLMYLEHSLSEEADFDALRLNRDSIRDVCDPLKMAAYARQAGGQALSHRFHTFNRWLYAES
ncbi:MAG: hypothetical protein EAZ89_20565 [Bacteroidetes bacterium]|nr:MAG: hypothetical protein EAZ89_20565 [Bacteroidota bacterium]